VQLVVNKRIIGPQDLQEGDQGGYYLSSPGLHRFLRQYTRRLNTTVKHPCGHTLTYQRILEVQARLLAKTIRGALDKYVPFRLR
jgi:CRISPR/Cas system-associated endonuclease Cas1